eukprot:6180191-Amphidinium_carterae.1
MIFVSAVVFAARWWLNKRAYARMRAEQALGGPPGEAQLQRGLAVNLPVAEVFRIRGSTPTPPQSQ